VESPFFTGPLRSPSRIQNTFAHECFVDELCASAQADPIEFRLKHLSEKRLIDVLKAAAKGANWETRRLRNLPRRATGLVTGRGVACVAYEGNNGYAALIAEVNVDPANGLVKPTKFVCAIDAGPISNPDGLRNQTEGGILQGMSRALGEEVTWDDHRVTSVEWESYHSLFVGMDTPSVEVVLVNRKDVPAIGAGETAITLVPAAIGNAIFDASGIRVRQVPFTPERVKAAMVRS
jgi:nicotinate dehydrogenase subunit B